MAIEIVPKQKIQIPGWAIVVLVFSAILFLALASTYIYLEIITRDLAKKIQEKEKALEFTPVERDLENYLSLMEEKINNFGSLLAVHKKSFNVFAYLESITHPDVQFTNFDFSPSKNAVDIKGTTKNFVSLGQQFLILKKENLLKEVNLSGITLAGGGEVGFSLQLTFDPKIFE